MTQSLPPMPAWATKRADSDYHVPGDGFTRFSIDLATQAALNWDQEPIRLPVTAVRYVQEWSEDRDWIEVWASGGGVLFMLTPDQARELAAALIKGADVLG